MSEQAVTFTSAGLKLSGTVRVPGGVKAGENDVVIMPSTFGLGLDPSVRKRDRNPTLFGTGKWNRVLIDATMNLDYEPDPDFGGARFPPTVWPEQDDIEKAYARWSELGLGKPKGG